MASEIERKFLIDRSHPDVVALMETRPRSIRQGYIMSGPTGVVRVRICGTKRPSARAAIADAAFALC